MLFPPWWRKSELHGSRRQHKFAQKASKTMAERTKKNTVDNHIKKGEKSEAFDIF